MRDLIERPLYINKIRPFMHSPFIKVLTGMRRCGKSTLLKLLQKELLLEGVPPVGRCDRGLSGGVFRHRSGGEAGH